MSSVSARMPGTGDRPPLLYLVHRIPYPPNKGDKLRSFHILRKLAERYSVYLGTFVDDPADRESITALREWCAEICAVEVRPVWRRLLSARGLLTGNGVSVTYFDSARLRRWVRTVCARHDIRIGVAFSGPMGQYLEAEQLERRIIDFCDVDSAKWHDYAQRHRWPMRWVYAREASLLQRFEGRVAATADCSLLTTPDEVALFREQQPDAGDRLSVLANGVDSDFFSPAAGGEDPWPQDARYRIVFTGVMDYWPNVDAVRWFASRVLPGIRDAHPGTVFAIVGMNPAPEVRALARESGIIVTGRVPDVRPWLAHAHVCVAPLRVARGVQNKVLEAMAMQRPVVASRSAATGIDAKVDDGLIVVDDAESFGARVGSLLSDPETSARLGRAARSHVLERFSWERNLAVLDELCAA